MKSTNKDVHEINIEGKKVFLVGTAHISQESVDTVREIIEEVLPDAICLELDENRYNSLKNKKNWESLNLLQVIKQKQLITLIFSLVLSSYQKKLSLQSGVSPGSEMLEADNLAKEKNIPVSFCDRDARITLKRAWRMTPLLKKTVLLGNIFSSFFDKTKIDESMLSDLRESDSLTEMMNELGQSLPTVKTVLIDERDLFLSQKIIETPGAKVVAVVGAGHVQGIKKSLLSNEKVDLDSLNSVPPPSLFSRSLGWFIPLTIILAVISLGYFKGLDVATENILYWVLANGIFCSLGALVALSHPLTILAAFVAAPITSLSPLIGAGYVTAFVQAFLQPPSVAEIQSTGKDFNVMKNWWKNKVYKIFLAFLLPGFGSMIGTWVGGYEIIKNLF